MKAGSQIHASRFKSAYACLYTSPREKSVGLQSEKVFRAPADFSPHDLDTDYDFHDFNAAVLDDPSALSMDGEGTLSKTSG